jgi:hypothetical protein
VVVTNTLGIVSATSRAVVFSWFSFTFNFVLFALGAC